MNIKGELVTKKSKKTGNDFIALELTFSNGFKKLVFLDTAEQYIVNSIDNR